MHAIRNYPEILGKNSQMRVSSTSLWKAHLYRQVVAVEVPVPGFDPG
jgi:hypothetical protein